jgi:hypothetical protein
VRGDRVDYGEVMFFFQFSPSNDNRAFALVSLYNEPDGELLRQSFGTLWVAKYLGKGGLGIVAVETLQSVVAMVPFMLSDTELANAEMSAKFSSAYFVSEKPFLEFLGTGDIASEEDINQEGGGEDEGY